MKFISHVKTFPQYITHKSEYQAYIIYAKEEKKTEQRIQICGPSNLSYLFEKYILFYPNTHLYLYIYYTYSLTAERAKEEYSQK